MIGFALNCFRIIRFLGGIRTIPRVAALEGYPCQMQKNQTFSCLFRHYAKHNGLRKEDLVFYFVNELHPDESPETVHLMPFDEVWVEHRKSDHEVKRETEKYSSFTSSFLAVMSSGDHSDVTFIVGTEPKEFLNAHKVILSARSDYFKAMFRKGGLQESIKSSVEFPSHEPSAFRRMLEYVYSNDVKGIELCSANEIIELLSIAHEFLLTDLMRLCETYAARILSVENIGALMLYCEKYDATILRQACHEFVSNNISILKMEETFRKEVAESPELALLLGDIILN